MRLVTFQGEDSLRLGALRERDSSQTVVDLNRADERVPSDLLRFLGGGKDAHARASDALEDAPDRAILDREKVTRKAVVPGPEKVICIGLNYRDHAVETNMDIPEVPTVFAKYANSLIGDGEPIIIPQVTEQVDYEAEFAFVIGRRGKYVPESEAMDYVAGYTVFNDVSGRDYQLRTPQWTVGKSFDTFGPIGPALVTADEVPDPHALDIRLSIDGEIMQDSNTRELIFSVPYLVSYLSQVMTLKPGDVIATGTPAGVGLAHQPPRWLRPGETVRVEIEGLGVLENPVVAE